MNRKQRRQARHRNPHLASRALFEDELRTALRKRGVTLVSCSTGQQGDEPRWVLELVRDSVRLFMHSPPKTVEGMVKSILDRLDGKEPEPKIEAQIVTEAVQSTPNVPITTNVPGNANVIEHREDLSRYLDEGLELKRP